MSRTVVGDPALVRGAAALLAPGRAVELDHASDAARWMIAADRDPIGAPTRVGPLAVGPIRRLPPASGGAPRAVPSETVIVRRGRADALILHTRGGDLPWHASDCDDPDVWLARDAVGVMSPRGWRWIYVEGALAGSPHWVSDLACLGDVVVIEREDDDLRRDLVLVDVRRGRWAVAAIPELEAWHVDGDALVWLAGDHDTRVGARVIRAALDGRTAR